MTPAEIQQVSTIVRNIIREMAPQQNCGDHGKCQKAKIIPFIIGAAGTQDGLKGANSILFYNNGNTTVRIMYMPLVPGASLEFKGSEKHVCFDSPVHITFDDPAFLPAPAGAVNGNQVIALAEFYE